MPHLHLSLQHGDDLILKRMKRRHLRADAIAFCDQVRRLRPDVVFGADIIAGFPTETEDAFARSRELVAECGLTHLHVFPFSERAGTPAARMPQVPHPLRKERARLLRQDGEAALHAPSRRRGRRRTPRARGVERHGPYRAVHAGAACGARRAGHDDRRHDRGPRRPASARRMIGNPRCRNMSDHRLTSVEQLEAHYGLPAGAAVWKEIDHINAAIPRLHRGGAVLRARERRPGGRRLLAARRCAGLRARHRREHADDPRPARQQPHRLVCATSCATRACRCCFSFRASARRSASSAAPASRPTRRCCESFVFAGKTPRAVIIVDVERVYFQCSKAIIRSKLWDPATPRRPQEPAEQRHHPRRDHRRARGRRGVRPGVSGAAAGRRFIEVIAVTGLPRHVPFRLSHRGSPDRPQTSKRTKKPARNHASRSADRDERQPCSQHEDGGMRIVWDRGVARDVKCGKVRKRTASQRPPRVWCQVRASETQATLKPPGEASSALTW